MSHLKKDIAADKGLLKYEKHKEHEKKEYERKDKKKPHSPTKDKGRAKVKLVMEEFKSGKLHSGSKHGPEVTNPKQAIAIALSESRKRKK